MRRPLALALAGLALLVLAMFADALVAPGSRVLGDARSDLPNQFLPWRAFGFGELAKGNLALWNPYVFGGAPFFGGMQSALLYPPNLLFLALPLPLAMNSGRRAAGWRRSPPSPAPRSPCSARRTSCGCRPAC
jgi:hypothetical protein